MNERVGADGESKGSAPPETEGDRMGPLINGLIIIKTLICKIPPNLPLLKGGITPLCLDLIVAENFAIWAWVNRSERLQGEPWMQGTLASKTPARIHMRCSPPIPLKCHFDRLLKP